MKKLCLCLCLLCLGYIHVFAADFYVNNQDGVRIYYKYINGGYDVAVINSGRYGNDYKGHVNIPEKVTYNEKTMDVKQIYEYAFYESEVESVTIPKCIESIGKYAFAKCAGLKDVYISDGVYRIEDLAFFDCPRLKSIVIPNSVINIGKSVFKGCTSLSSITLSNNISVLSSNCFEGCSSLTNIEIPNGVERIGESAFAYCTSLSSINIHDKIKGIGNSAFYGCTSLTKITIPNSVEELGSFAFAECTALTDVELSKNIMHIEIGLFSGCIKLSNIDISACDISWIREKAFYNCRSITSITIPKSVTIIGEEAFMNATNLNSLVIKFNDIYNHKTLWINKSSFYCAKLMSVVSFNEHPREIRGIKYSDSTFHPNTVANGILYVPTGSVETYKKTMGWQDFKNIVEFNPTTIEVVNRSNNKKMVVYDLSGRAVTQPRKGINIINGKKYVIK